MSQIISQYSQTKAWLSELLGASEELLHLHAGLLIFVVAALLFRRHMRSRIPISLVYVFAMGNEVADLLAPSGNPRDWEPLADFLNTVVWPTLLFVLARRRIGTGQSG